MIKKFEEFQLSVPETVLAVVAGQYTLSYLFGLVKKYGYDRINRNYVKEMIDDLFDLKEWKIEEDNEKITIIRDYKLSSTTVHSGGLTMVLNKSRGTVQFPTTIRKNSSGYGVKLKTSKDEIKIERKLFNRIIEDVNWLKEVSDNIEECFVEVTDLGFKMVSKMSIKTGKVEVSLYPQSGEKLDVHSETEYAKQLTEEESSAISISSQRCESMFGCKSSIRKSTIPNYEHLIEEVVVDLVRNKN